MLRKFATALLLLSVVIPSDAAVRCGITSAGNTLTLSSGVLTRTIKLDGSNIITESLQISGHEMLAAPSGEISMTFTLADPNRRPVGIRPGETEAVEQSASMAEGTDTLDVKQSAQQEQSVKWVKPITLNSANWSQTFDTVSAESSREGLVIRARATTHPILKGVCIELNYTALNDCPAIKKSIRIVNRGDNWLKIENLRIDGITLSPAFSTRTLLTPEERGAGASIIAFGNKGASQGIIAVSEVPSALRFISNTGSMGYADENFEWVLGPNEEFVSEPVFHFGFSGWTHKTASGVSTPLDRTVEGPFKRFLEEHIGVAADPDKLPVPLWCSWSNFGPNINDSIIREQADIAAKCGFVGFQLDAGWAADSTGSKWGTCGIKPYTAKFPDFTATSRYIRDKGLKLGLWVSSFRVEQSDDLKAFPDGASLPEVRRDGGVGMSFCSPWKNLFADTLEELNIRYGMIYVKQDLSNIRFGDIAEGHESRTKKESLLRGLRGLCAAEDRIRANVPGITPEITHELYWGTPGVPADVAALKHAATYHIPPNDYSGCGNNKQRPNESWTYDPLKLRNELTLGCFHARQRFYAHRGLPLFGIEYYGAATVNFRDSLTPEVQDRQVCSWLMGVPSVYSGDLASLTQENIAQYRKRFDLIKRLQKDYGIYRYFQYSGVPEPTDTDWHWWGKLNPKGLGAVVILRGTAGENERRINIPWVLPAIKYKVKAQFANKELGIYTGKQLQDGKLTISLPPLGQEILELATITK